MGFSSATNGKSATDGKLATLKVEKMQVYGK